MERTIPRHIFFLIFLFLTFQLHGIFSSKKVEVGEVAAERAVLLPVQIQAVPSGSLPQVNAGYCQLGQSTVTFTNLGQDDDPGASLISDLSLGIALGDGFSLSDNAFEVTAVRIAGVDLSSVAQLNALNGNPQFTTDPDGPGGLEDVDDDGFFDDLGLGESVEITAFYRFGCGLATGTSSSCVNNFETSLSARMSYVEQGGASQMFELKDYLEPSHKNTAIQNFSDPDAFLGVDTFFVTHSQSRSIRFFNTNCNGTGQFVAKIALPIGVTPVIGMTHFVKNETDTVPLLFTQVVNDTLELTYDASFSNILSGDYELGMAFTADCFVALGISKFPISLEHFCPSCNCHHLWYCGEIAGPQLHVTSPPCPVEVLLDCDKGIQTIGFEVERTTFGFVDEDYSIPFPPASANKKVAIGCDSVQMLVTSTVGSTSLSDSIGVVVEYSNPDGSSSAGEVFLFHRASVRFTHDGNEFDCPISPNELNVASVGGMKTLTFDLNACVAGLGFSLTQGDTVEFLGEFVVNPDGPFSNDFTLVPDFRAFAFANLAGQTFACDNFGEQFMLGKSRAVYDFPNSALGQPHGCENGELHFRLFVPDNDFADYFGNELRAATKVDSFVLDFDPALLDAYADIELEVSIPGHPIFGDSYFPIQSLTDFPDGHYVASFDTLVHVPTLNLIEEYTFDLVLRLRPNCEAALTDAFDLASQINFFDRYYAESIGDGECLEEKVEAGNSQLIYTDPPLLSLVPVAPAVDSVQGGVGQWTFQLCNDSPTATANVTWLAIENPGGNLAIQSLTNISNPSSPIPLIPIPYPDGSFSFVATLFPGECAELQLMASIQDCEDFGFSLRAGWNCGPFNVANWNPSLNPPCEEAVLPLALVNQLPSPVSIDIQEVTSECVVSGGELVSISGELTSTETIPVDNFTLSYIFDKNGDGEVQPTDSLLSELTVTGAIEPGSPLPFGQTFTFSPEMACQLLVQLAAANTELCDGVLLELPTPQLLNAGSDQYFCELSGSVLTTNLGAGICDDSFYDFTWTPLPPANVDDLTDVNSPVPTLALAWQDFLGQTLTYILETERTDCSLSTFDTVEIILPLAPGGYFEADSTIIQAPDCQSLVELCLNVSPSDFPNLTVTDNGLPYPQSAFVPCQDSLQAMQLAVGSHEIVALNLATGCTDTVFATVQCATTETVVVDLLLNESDTICFPNDQIFGAIETLENLCPDGAFASYELFADSCLIITGNWVGSEQACMLACDNIGFCDTTLVQVNVLHPIPNGVKDSIVIEQQAEYCFDEDLLNIAGPIALIENICENQSGNSVDFTIDESTNCISYFGEALGVDSACVRLCDADGNCDTISVCVSVIPGSVVFDTIFITVDTNIFCLEDSLLPGDVTMVEDICPEINGDEVEFTIEGNCISYWGPEVGTDTACIRFEDEFGNVGLLQLIVTVVKTIPATICDTVFVGQNLELCLDTLELPGNYSYIQEVCPDAHTGNVFFFLEPVTLCVNYEGVNEGVDSACIVVCDDFGFCDTTYLCITVAEYFDPPGLGDDTTSTQKATPVVIDFLANDTLYGGIVDIFILEQPISGSATLNLDHSFTYTPDDPFCARWDNFTYVACNPNGCDTATVSIFIECIELTVFSAVSPNNDGVNDVFYIAKIEDFPDNKIWVYNRWGNLVFESREYENNWPGSWGDDIDLPDGTYYYILEWSDGGETTVQRGYFEMFR